MTMKNYKQLFAWKQNYDNSVFTLQNVHDGAHTYGDVVAGQNYDDDEVVDDDDDDDDVVFLPYST